MPTNDLILLESSLALAKKESQLRVDDSNFFELFCCEQVLKETDVSIDEISAGIIDGGDDGGIDALYSFVNSELLDSDTELEQFAKGALIDLYLLQVKQSESFAEQPFDRLMSTVDDIFDLGKPVDQFSKHYNSALLEKVQKFRDAYIYLSGRHARLSIHCFYISKGDTGSAHPKVLHKSELFRARLESYFNGATVSVALLGARELLSAAQKQRSYTLQLKLIENPISTGEGSYVALASLRDYAAFVTDERGALRKYIFDSNVRDYQGDVDVNADIRKSLQEENPKLNFWWLNNGVTILASKATLAAKTITLDDVQVVNGLQTTTSIYNYLRAASMPLTDNRSVLVRIVETADSEARDRIIKATNHQTAIPSASLKATDRIQRDIESYFLTRGWYYDRRKNYYKNQGRPSSRIVSIPYLAQGVMAIVLREPNNSRGRPSTLIKDDSDYKRVFNPSFNLELYLVCVLIMKLVDQMELLLSSYEIEVARNLRFHIAMFTVVKLLKSTAYPPVAVSGLTHILHSEDVSDRERRWYTAESAVVDVLAVLTKYREKTSYSVDRIAKSKEFVDELLANVRPCLSEDEERDLALTIEREESPAVSLEGSALVTDEDIPF